MQSLKKRKDFVRLGVLRQSWVADGFILLAAKRNADDSTGCDVTRIGFTASKKVGIAVVRNLAKRRMRVLSRLILSPKGLAGFDYVLIARSALITLPFEKLKKDLEKSVQCLHMKYFN